MFAGSSHAVTDCIGHATIAVKPTPAHAIACLAPNPGYWIFTKTRSINWSVGNALPSCIWKPGEKTTSADAIPCCTATFQYCGNGQLRLGGMQGSSASHLQANSVTVPLVLALLQATQQDGPKRWMCLLCGDNPANRDKVERPSRSTNRPSSTNPAACH